MSQSKNTRTYKVLCQCDLTEAERSQPDNPENYEDEIVEIRADMKDIEEFLMIASSKIDQWIGHCDFNLFTPIEYYRGDDIWSKIKVRRRFRRDESFQNTLVEWKKVKVPRLKGRNITRLEEVKNWEEFWDKQGEGDNNEENDTELSKPESDL